MENFDLTGIILKKAYEVHTALGPGLLESTYEECLCYELALYGLKVERQKTLPIEYKGIKIWFNLFYEYEYIPILGNKEKGNAYVYSPDLDLSSLSSCELAVFGLANAHKTKFKNWFYTGPLG